MSARLARLRWLELLWGSRQMDASWTQRLLEASVFGQQAQIRGSLSRCVARPAVRAVGLKARLSRLLTSESPTERR